MSMYSLTVRTLNTLAGQACWEIYTPPTLEIKIFEIGISNIAATTTVVGLAKPAVAGVGPLLPTSFIAEQDSGLPTSQTLSAVSWSTSAPTVPTAGFNRRASIVGAIGAGVLWTFPKGLYIPSSTSMCIFNITASGSFDCWAIISE